MLGGFEWDVFVMLEVEESKRAYGITVMQRGRETRSQCSALAGNKETDRFFFFLAICIENTLHRITAISSVSSKVL